MLKKILSTCLILALTGCGGSSDDSSENELTSLAVETSSTVSFYIAPWQSSAGTLIISNEDSSQVQTQIVDDINSVTLALDSLDFHRVEFISESTSLTCPSFDGCGRTLRDNENDLNGNRFIDFEEVMPLSLNYKAVFFSAPGENKVYLSPVSSLAFDESLDMSLASLSATPFYHLTHSQLNDNLEAEILTNALTFGVILQAAKEIEANLGTDIEPQTTIAASLTGITDYATYAQQYASENLLNIQGNQLIQAVIGDVKQRLFAIGQMKSAQPFATTEQALDSRVLLEDVRDVIGVIRLQEKKYSDELEAKLTEVETLLDTDSQQTVLTLSNVLYDVLSNFSPISNEDAGTYSLGDLSVVYTDSPYIWQITGTYDGQDVFIDMNVPKWQISSVLGNQIIGELNAKISNETTVLSVDVSELIISFDGTDDPFELEQDEVTGIGTITTDILLEKNNAQLAGTITASIDRFVSPFEELLTVVSGFDFDGEISSELQNIGIIIQAIETTPFINEENANIAFSLQLAMALNGAPGFKLAYVGELDELDNVSNGDVFLTLQNRALDLNIRQVGENINAVIKGQYGRWLDIKQKGRNYSGGLYFGDTQIADVTAVRGVPGILFPDGTFESLF
ncbi:hypothetical protein NQT69_00550 [Pseudoalteromonas shioyasakiensis]|uniref:hypothetical protein n=1 Tax=Pseudoalteromonas shioyasakiensis TaxID=1190813 RepID=UPI002118688C|nr:hypothetical protein [Pseudoalteromonas shioyasakiensis]MCQ8876529.1 hypothetical protein [Pseudoalteromonas shioyasakiensis]